jgi:hypothetical protein
MSNLAPVPESNSLNQINGGYQLCARCGELLLENEIAVVTPRLSSWLIYTHETCPNGRLKAVKGWKVILSAEATRRAKNMQTARRSEPYDVGGAKRECVCLLDTKHINAERALADYWPSDEAVTNTDDLRSILSYSESCGEDSDAAHAPEDGEEQSSEYATFCGVLRHNLEEERLILQIDAQSLNQDLEGYLDCLWSCRERFYITIDSTASQDFSPLGLVSAKVSLGVRPNRVRLKLSPGADVVLTRDSRGKPVEYPLYSRYPVLKIARKRIAELEAWTLKPDPVELPYNSLTDPKSFLWAAWSLRQLEPVDSSNPFGPVAILMQESDPKPTRPRNVGFRAKNIQWEAAEEALPELATSV